MALQSYPYSVMWLHKKTMLIQKVCDKNRPQTDPEDIDLYQLCIHSRQEEDHWIELISLHTITYIPVSLNILI